MKTCRLFLALVFALILGDSYGQQDLNASKFILKLSGGAGIAGTGDMQMVLLENSLDFKINNYFTPSISVMYGKSDKGVFLTSSMIQGNVNLFFSPFKNNKVNNFKIGTGISFMNISNFYETARFFEAGAYLYSEYAFDKYNTTGLNIILEDDYQLTNRFMIGLKVFTRMYQNGDLIIGTTVNFGVNL